MSADPHTLPLMEGEDLVPFAQLEVSIIRHALEVTGGNTVRAAKALGIGRSTIYRKAKTPHEPAAADDRCPEEPGLEDA